jgi:hypothetical protein
VPDGEGLVLSFSAYIGMPPCRLVSAIDHYQSDITLIGQSSSAWGARSWVTVWVIDSAAKLAMMPMTVVTVGTRAESRRWWPGAAR